MIPKIGGCMILKNPPLRWVHDLRKSQMLGIDTPRIVAFGATDSVTVWDHIRYTIRDYPKDDDEDGYIDEECFSYAGDDCDDDDSSVHPSAIERCDLKDNDCDGFTDEGLELHKSCVAVAIGECRFSNLLLCQNGEYVCQPSEPQPEEGPGEGCNGKDDDCDGLIDEENDLCGPPPSCSPQPEICDGLDDDCDGSVDEAPLPDVGQQCNEAYPWPGVPHTAECNIGTWYCSTFGYLDCVSLDGGKPEQCDGMDNNCNGDVDENCLLQTSSPGGYMTGSGWQPSDCVFLTEAAELSACFQCMESLAPYPGTSSCSDDYFGCLAGFNDERGILLGPFPVPPAYPSGTYLLSYNFGDGGKTAYIKKITIIGQDEWVSQFPLAFDFIAYETEDLVTNPDFEQGVFLSQARVIRRLVDVPVPAGNKITFYFEPQIETRNLAIAIHGLRWWQDPDLADGDDSGCFTALESVTFQGGLLPEHTQLFDSDGDGLADGYEISLGLDPLAASVCELECLVYSSRIDNQGVENSLASKAANACRKYQKGNNIAAGNILNAFSNEVEAQRGNHIPESVADILVTYAEAVGQAL